MVSSHGETESTITYTYDSVGNRLTMSDGTDTYAYTYNQFNQLKTITKNNSAYATYTYDSRGNQINASQVYMTVGNTKHNQVTDYTYDLQNQMTQAKITTPDYVNNAVVNNEVIQTNAYNASGQRIQKAEDGETTNYYYMGSALLLSANANNWLLTENILDPSGTIVASARFDDTNPGVAEGFYFYHYDMRGSTTAIVGANGALQKGYTYDEFGSVEESGNVSFLNEVTFTGSVTDKSTGLQYMNARFYDPATGRFISRDSYTGNPYDPWTQHLYTYCGNNPTNMVDPTGHAFYKANAYDIQAQKSSSQTFQFLKAKEAKSLLADSYRGAGNYEMANIYATMADSYWKLYNQKLYESNALSKKAHSKRKTVGSSATTIVRAPIVKTETVSHTVFNIVSHETGAYADAIVSNIGDDSRSIVFYSETILEPSSGMSTAGVIARIGNFSQKAHIGIKDTGTEWSLAVKDSSYYFSLRTDAQDGRIGVEWGTTRKGEYAEVTEYTYLSIDSAFTAMVVGASAINPGKIKVEWLAVLEKAFAAS